MCDAVKAESYEIDRIEVSNFLLPLYFTGGEELGGCDDFLGKNHQGKTLASFGVNPGGYIGFFDLQKGDYDTFHLKGEKTAAKRLELKSQANGARRGIRYQRLRSAKSTSRPKR